MSASNTFSTDRSMSDQEARSQLKDGQSRTGRRIAETTFGCRDIIIDTLYAQNLSSTRLLDDGLEYQDEDACIANLGKRSESERSKESRDGHDIALRLSAKRGISHQQPTSLAQRRCIRQIETETRFSDVQASDFERRREDCLRRKNGWLVGSSLALGCLTFPSHPSTLASQHLKLTFALFCTAITRHHP